ncbi:hypothetical protein B879_04145 [Cecembia lonarensis LW9]|uniref:Uncharacterized protein n=1 Tax=Cecembia lonarensis (strain CCUG 58316 / KCTC 22772 / LW9) TaxID=1225176 RepID=K1LT39_CECL9|nr:hypothetical protein B879_04145 [Cecembia lonarensis LW9]
MNGKYFQVIRAEGPGHFGDQRVCFHSHGKGKGHVTNDTMYIVDGEFTGLMAQQPVFYGELAILNKMVDSLDVSFCSGFPRCRAFCQPFLGTPSGMLGNAQGAEKLIHVQ